VDAIKAAVARKASASPSIRKCSHLMRKSWLRLCTMSLMAAACCCADLTPAKSRPTHERPANDVPLPGMPPVVDLTNLYSEIAPPNRLNQAVTGALPRVYVPNVVSKDVYVIDPATFQVVDRFKVGGTPQHVVLPRSNKPSPMVPMSTAVPAIRQPR
jgi:YVTN family beta-propeller protein